jgi:hypothetical protein
MFGCRAVGGTVVPGTSFFDRRELGNDHSFDFRPFEVSVR